MNSLWSVTLSQKILECLYQGIKLPYYFVEIISENLCKYKKQGLWSYVAKVFGLLEKRQQQQPTRKNALGYLLKTFFLCGVGNKKQANKEKIEVK